jgi:hypothetical protein
MLSRSIIRILFTGTTLLLLNACASTTTTASDPASSPVASPSENTAAAPTADPAVAPATPAATETSAKEEGAQKGGQVVEMGDYHLELLAAPEGENIHVDFWLMTGADHASLGDAKVTASIQFPNGTQKTVDLIYDETGQHYKALVPGFVAGEYRVVVQTERSGEKVNGRFNFKL